VTVDRVIEDVLRREGGYVDHPADRGGCTNHGITQATLADYRGTPVSCTDVRTLTIDEARRIYRRLYVEGPGFHLLTDGPLQALLVDYAVHSGPRRAVQALQRVVGTSTDGVLGPQTVAAIERIGADMARRGVLRLRGEWIAGILQHQPDQRVFAAGWLRRLLEFV
jgi:lysozyme family protein